MTKDDNLRTRGDCGRTGWARDSGVGGQEGLLAGGGREQNQMPKTEDVRYLECSVYVPGQGSEGRGDGESVEPGSGVRCLFLARGAPLAVFCVCHCAGNSQRVDSHRRPASRGQPRWAGRARSEERAKLLSSTGLSVCSPVLCRRLSSLSVLVSVTNDAVKHREWASGQAAQG